MFLQFTNITYCAMRALDLLSVYLLETSSTKTPFYAVWGQSRELGQTKDLDEKSLVNGDHIKYMK